MNNFVIAKNVTKMYQIDKLMIPALSNATFEIKEGSFTVILGPSGAGKTTLLNLLGGMDFLTNGSLIVDGQELGGLNSKERTMYRRNAVGFVFQFYNLMPNLTALENVELATEVTKKAYNPLDILKKVGLEDKIKNFPAQLSGGEQQRVSIARAIAKNPKILLCDEPTGALDYETGKMILKLLHTICKEENKTVIIVTHNAAIKEMADQVIYIKNGKVEKNELNQNPKSVEEIEW